MVFVQKWPFFQLFFLGNIGQENVLYDTLQQKTNFLGYKNKKFKKSKNWHFPKGITHGFRPKMTISPTSFLRQYRPGKCLLPYLKKKATFKAIKTRSSNNRKIDIFQKGITHGFGSKMAIFPTLFFWHYRPKKGVLWYSRTRKRLSRLLKQKGQKVEKLTFFQRG